MVLELVIGVLYSSAAYQIKELNETNMMPQKSDWSKSECASNRRRKLVVLKLVNLLCWIESNGIELSRIWINSIDLNWIIVVDHCWPLTKSCLEFLPRLFDILDSSVLSRISKFSLNLIIMANSGMMSFQVLSLTTKVSKWRLY